MHSWNCPKMETKTSGQSMLAITCHRPSLDTVLHFLVRSKYVVQRATSFSMHFFCNCRAAQIMSTVTLLALKPHWLFRYYSTAQKFCRDISRDISVVWRDMKPKFGTGHNGKKCMLNIKNHYCALLLKACFFFASVINYWVRQMSTVISFMSLSYCNWWRISPPKNIE